MCLGRARDGAGHKCCSMWAGLSSLYTRTESGRGIHIRSRVLGNSGSGRLDIWSLNGDEQ